MYENNANEMLEIREQSLSGYVSHRDQVVRFFYVRLNRAVYIRRRQGAATLSDAVNYSSSDFFMKNTCSYDYSHLSDLEG